MVEDLSHAVHVDLVDVHRGNVPHEVVANGLLEWRQPVLVGLLAHSGRDERGALPLPGVDGGFPQRGSGPWVDRRGHWWRAVWLVETLDVLRVPVHALESLESVPVLATSVSVTPQGGHVDQVGVARAVGRGLVV